MKMFKKANPFEKELINPMHTAPTTPVQEATPLKAHQEFITATTTPIDTAKIRTEPKATIATPFKSGSYADDRPETIIGEGVKIIGEIHFQNFLRIDGTFQGVLHSSGKLHLGPKGHVRSNLKLRDAIIEGTLEGNIETSDTLELRSTAHVKGNISAQSLKVHPGASIAGQVSISPPAVASEQATETSIRLH